MIDISPLTKLKPFPSMAILALLGGTFFPGYLYLFYYQRDLYESIHPVSFGILSVAVALPGMLLIFIQLIIFYVATVSGTEQQRTEPVVMVTALFASILNGSFLSLEVVLGYLDSQSFRESVVAISRGYTWGSLGVAAYSSLVLIIRKYKKKTIHKQNDAAS